jgi:phenylalanyl-tRNA synthetase beta chain
MRRRLTALGMACRREGPVLVVTPPSWRGDLEIEEDLAEELARLGGYDRVPTTLPLVAATGADEGADRRTVRRIRGLLAAEGLSEMVTLTLTDPETNRVAGGVIGAARTPIALANPLSSELSALRLNTSHGAAFFGGFEVGKGFGRDDRGAVAEWRAVAGLLAGSWPARGVERTGPVIEFGDVKGVVQNLLAGLGIPDDEVRWHPAADVAILHPGKAARITAADTLLHYRPRRVGVRALPRFPAITRDIAVVVDESFQAESILEEVRALADPLVESASVFDCYRGAQIPEGKKSLAYTIAYRASDRTLTDEEVSAAHERVRDHLNARFALTLRS